MSTSFIKEHIMGAVDLLAAAKAGDQPKVAADDVKDYDAVHDHILGLADTLTKGIVAQFPDRVSNT